MTASIDPVALAAQLIACHSVTPATGSSFDILEAALHQAGFSTHRFIAGEAPDGPVENLFAIRGTGAPHFAYAGHLDVVPPGEGWSSDPFTPEIRGDMLYGRGAVDMKGSIAAFVAAAARKPQHDGTVSLIITGDEEGSAVYGTVALMDWMAENAHRPDMCLVGEPTSVNRLGDMMKIGRRGSVNMWIEVAGTQGHVAYPHLADNPIPALVRILSRIDAITLDTGNDWFQPSNIEITDIHVGNPATNVIPASAKARISIRFNDEHNGAALIARIEAICTEESARAALVGKISGEAFLTAPGPLSSLVSDAIVAVTGVTPELSTTGGTSDARFLSRLCPVVEFGLPNATMHKLDEAASLEDIRALADIFEKVIDAALTPA